MSDQTNGVHAAPKSKIQERIEAARKQLDATKARLSKDDLEEIAEREELAKIEEANAAAKAEARDLDLDRRMDAAREKHGADAKLAPVIIQGYDDTFIVKLNGLAYKKWDKTINDSSNGKIDAQEERRKLVAASLADWNGETDFGPTSLVGAKILAYLDAHQGIVAPLIQEICILNGVVKEARKSKG